MRRPIVRSIPAALALLIASFTWAGSNPAHQPASSIQASDVADTVRMYIGEETRVRDGLCRITDPVENATLDLKLKSVYAEKLMRVKSDTFVTCAFFEGPDGTTYDVDFYVKGTTRKNLKVIDATIHAKNGLQRYAWDNDKGVMRIKALSSEMPMRDELAH